MVSFETVTDGLAFPEGPVALPDGSVIVTEIARGCITRVFPDGRKERVAETGGGPNGLAMGPGGKLYCTNNGGFSWSRGANGEYVPHGVSDDYAGGSIQRIDIATGMVETVYKTGDFGCVLRGPNDLQFDAHGGFWFTDLGKQDPTTRCQDITGIFYAKPDGSLLEEAIFPASTPNGIGLSPDGKTLYVAETYTCRLTRYPVTAPGKADAAAGGGPFGPPLYRPAGWKFFDSLAMEANGNICVATIGECGISVVSPEGALVDFIATDDIYTTNICFGGADMRDAWITLSGTGRLVKTRWARPGMALPY